MKKLRPANFSMALQYNANVRAKKHSIFKPLTPIYYITKYLKAQYWLAGQDPVSNMAADAFMHKQYN